MKRKELWKNLAMVVGLSASLSTTAIAAPTQVDNYDNQVVEDYGGDSGVPNETNNVVYDVSQAEDYTTETGSETDYGSGGYSSDPQVQSVADDGTTTDDSGVVEGQPQSESETEEPSILEQEIMDAVDNAVKIDEVTETNPNAKSIAGVEKSVTSRGQKEKWSIGKDYSRVTSMNPSIVSVEEDPEGGFIATSSDDKTGKAVLRYFDDKGKLVKSETIEVLKKASISFEVESPEVTLGVNRRGTLKLNLPNDGQFTVKWSSSNEDVATVTDTGEVTSHKMGNATIKAEIYKDGKLVKTLEKSIKVSNDPNVVNNGTNIDSKNNGNTGTTGNTGTSGTSGTGSNTKGSNSTGSSPNVNYNNGSGKNKNGNTNSSTTNSGTNTTKKTLRSVACNIKTKYATKGQGYDKSNIVVTEKYTDGTTAETTDFSYTLDEATGKLVVTHNSTGAKFTFNITMKDPAGSGDSGNTNQGDNSSGENSGNNGNQGNNQNGNQGESEGGNSGSNQEGSEGQNTNKKITNLKCTIDKTTVERGKDDTIKVTMTATYEDGTTAQVPESDIERTLVTNPDVEKPTSGVLRITHKPTDKLFTFTITLTDPAEGGNEGGNQGESEGGNQGESEGGNQGGNEGGNQGESEGGNQGEEQNDGTVTYVFNYTANGEGAKPTVTITVKKNGEDYTTKTVDLNSTSSCTISNLPKFEGNNPITWGVSESYPDGWNLTSSTDETTDFEKDTTRTLTRTLEKAEDNPQTGKRVAFSITRPKMFRGEDYLKSYIKVEEIDENENRTETQNFTFNYDKETGQLLVTHTETGLNQTFMIELVDNPVLTSLSSECNKTIVNVGEEYAKSNLKVYEHYGDEVKETSDFTFTVDTSHAGTTDLVITHTPTNTVCGTYQITVVDANTQVFTADYDGESPLSLENSQDSEYMRSHIHGYLEDGSGNKTPIVAYSASINYDDKIKPTTCIITVTCINPTTQQPNPDYQPVTINVPLQEVDNPPIEDDPSTVKIKSLSVTASPSHVYVNQDLGENQLTAVATYTDGSTKDLSQSDLTFDWTPQATPGTYPLAVTYDGLTANCNILVKEESQEETKSYNVSYNDDDPYVLTTDTDIDGTKIVVTDESTGETLDPSKYSYRFENSGVAGTNSHIYVSIDGVDGEADLEIETKAANGWKSAEFGVKDNSEAQSLLKEDTDLEETNPDRIYFEVEKGYEFDKDDFKVVVTLNDDSTKTLESKDFDLEWNDKDNVGTRELKIKAIGSYGEELGTSFKVVVLDMQQGESGNGSGSALPNETAPEPAPEASQSETSAPEPATEAPKQETPNETAPTEAPAEAPTEAAPATEAPAEAPAE